MSDAILDCYIRLAMGGHVTMPDGLDYTYRDIAAIVGNGREMSFAQFREWCGEYMETSHQMRLELEE